ncbi:hypothetical protein BJX99DRAFT_229515 [Aspergillus californicus]
MSLSTEAIIALVALLIASIPGICYIIKQARLVRNPDLRRDLPLLPVTNPNPSRPHSPEPSATFAAIPEHNRDGSIAIAAYRPDIRRLSSTLSAPFHSLPQSGRGLLESLRIALPPYSMSMIRHGPSSMRVEAGFVYYTGLLAVPGDSGYSRIAVDDSETSPPSEGSNRPEDPGALERPGTGEATAEVVDTTLTTEDVI